MLPIMDRGSDVTAAAEPPLTAYIDAQWLHHQHLVDLPMAIRRLVGLPERNRLLAQAAALPAFDEWSGHNERTLRLYRAAENRQRLAFVLGLIGEGERIVDIGCGSGSIGGRIITFKRPARYAAIEPSPNQARAFRGMAAEHRFPAGSWELHEATTEDVGAVVLADVQPTLVLLLEVLEHVRDPDRIVADVAAAMPTECDLLISVPMIGSIEFEWGHRSVFDRSRLERMAREAGLSVHWVQPIADHWLFLLLSASAAPRARLAALTSASRATLIAAAAPEQAYFWAPVAVNPSTVTLRRRTRSRRGEIHQQGRSTVLALRGRRTVTVRIDTGPMAVVRVRVNADPPRRIRKIVAELGNGGQAVERWRLNKREVTKIDGTGTWVFRRGFDADRRHANLRPGIVAHHVDLTLTTRGPVRLEFQLVECVVPIDNSTQPQAPWLRAGVPAFGNPT